jgi:hypothetical protein
MGGNIIDRTKRFLKYGKEVDLTLDNCPPTFDFTEAGNTPIEKIDKSFRVMEKVNRVAEDYK